MREFLFEKVYYHEKLRSNFDKAKKVLSDLYLFFLNNPKKLNEIYKSKTRSTVTIVEILLPVCLMSMHWKFIDSSFHPKNGR